MSVYTPTNEEISEAIEEGNRLKLAQYIQALEVQKQIIGQDLPRLLEAFGNAKRDLDVKKAAYNHVKTTINSMQSVLKSLQPVY